ncbi:Acetyltransferase (GNAT) family protein [Tritonibacter multivorans]|uniref:Acetyltransferase (GNAT) family protein n=1 Tax=Tritonibacter multivorans TaxID=928856 RepID=A0A0P1GY38_9RHOB|nr:GNAT family N-acetyltransferase [Tritonibacter multivorans]MDA7420801.1 GNAT family N-acetyltransferase [Tritonibacter multivorans]CUH80966.1 Acetyltransferase (GNAT) family protein [Tritonibacter multivorans]SFC86276.1 Acetyltransferase (GNAT) family protein [Tritonibacter multivorans]
MTLADGITELTPGKIAAVVTYLQMFARPASRDVSLPSGLSVQRHAAPTVDWYRDLYRLVGEDYLWFSRLEMADEKLAAHLARDAVEVWSVSRAGRDLGLLELEWFDNGDCELSFFGLAPDLVGGGIGRWLMEHALERAFARPIKRFFVHTCTLDSPQALGFYERSGFEAYGRAIEIVDDPRNRGLIALDKAPQIPLLPAG